MTKGWVQDGIIVACIGLVREFAPCYGFAQFKASAFDNVPVPLNWKKPLRDKELTDSIQVKS
jgi:hypothetical protein